MGKLPRGLIGAHASGTGTFSSRNERSLPIFVQRGPKTVSSYSTLLSL